MPLDVAFVFCVYSVPATSTIWQLLTTNMLIFLSATVDVTDHFYDTNHFSIDFLISNNSIAHKQLSSFFATNLNSPVTRMDSCTQKYNQLCLWQQCRDSLLEIAAYSIDNHKHQWKWCRDKNWRKIKIKGEKKKRMFIWSQSRQSSPRENNISPSGFICCFCFLRDENKAIIKTAIFFLIQFVCVSKLVYR